MEEILLRRLTDGADEFLEALTRLRIVEGDADALTDLAIKVELYGTISIDHFAIDLLDDHTSLDLITELHERTTSEDLLDLEAIARVLLIVEGTKVTRLLSPTLRMDTSSRMRSIQLSEELAQHFSEVLIIINVREELAVGLTVVVPVDPMEVDVIELLLDLLPCVVEDILTLSCGTMLKLSSEADRLEVTTIELIEARGRTDIDGLPILTEHQATTTDTCAEELRRLLFEVTLPEVVGVLILSDVVELLTIIGDDGIRE